MGIYYWTQYILMAITILRLRATYQETAANRCKWLLRLLVFFILCLLIHWQVFTPFVGIGWFTFQVYAIYVFGSLAWTAHAAAKDKPDDPAAQTAAKRSAITVCSLLASVLTTFTTFLSFSKMEQIHQKAQKFAEGSTLLPPSW